MKKITAILLSLVMAWNMGLMCISAADNQEFIINVYQREAGELNLLCAIPGETGSGESFEVTLGESELLVKSVSTVGEEQVPKTVYCLVDISGSMKGRMEQAKEILYKIGSGLNEKDNLVIGKMGNQITDSGFLSGKDDMIAEIDSLQYTREDTDLYSGLVHGLKFLQQNTGVNTMCALVVLSDGCDDQGDGSTWREAYEAVGKADIPVYTAAIILSSADYEQAKELGSFARNSAGGMHFPKSGSSGSAPVKMTGEEIGTEILGAMDGTVHLCVDMSKVQKTEKDTCMLSVTFCSEEGRVYKDSRELVSGELELLPDETETETESGKQEEAGEDRPQPEPAPALKPAVLALITGGVLLAVIIAVVFMVRRKKSAEEKKRQEEERLERELEEQERLKAERLAREQELEREEKLKQSQREQELAREQARQEAMRQEQEIFNALPRLTIHLSAIGQKGKAFTIRLVKGYEMTVGRTGKARVVLDPQDSKLSGIHFVMFWDGGSVYVWDGQSKNGTSVNGVVVNHLGRVAVKPGDSIRAGSYEYRLYWED